MSTFKWTNSNKKNEYFWSCNPYESKARPVFPVSENLKFLLLNEQIQMENECYRIMYCYVSEMYCLTFKHFCYSDILQSISIC